MKNTPMDVLLLSGLAERAFAIWEQAGHPDGREWDAWDQAETELAPGIRASTPSVDFRTFRRKQTRPA
jgi:hypothetical protein